jgi:aminoglycoside 3-N-acetyltransferase I
MRLPMRVGGDSFQSKSVRGGAVSNVLVESWGGAGKAGLDLTGTDRFDGDRQELAMSQDAPVVIRQLGSGDAEVVRRLLDTFGEVFEDMDTYTRAQPRAAYLEGLLCSDHFIALAALQDGVVIGGLAAYELKKFERERSEIYIYDLAVAARHRRRGIATSLIAQLTTIAKARGAYGIFVQADLTDPAAIALYTKLGTRENVLHFDIAVP